MMYKAGHPGVLYSHCVFTCLYCLRVVYILGLGFLSFLPYD